MLAALGVFFALASAVVAQVFNVPGPSGAKWLDTGLDITPGTLIELHASGEVDIGGGRRFGPQGTGKFTDGTGFPAETRYRYGLVARLTASRNNPGDELSEQWVYGEQHGYCAARGGHLWLTVNDNEPTDNQGAFVVETSLRRCPSETSHCYGVACRPHVRNHAERCGTKAEVPGW